MTGHCSLVKLRPDSIVCQNKVGVCKPIWVKHVEDGLSVTVKQFSFPNHAEYPPLVESWLDEDHAL